MKMNIKVIGWSSTNYRTLVTFPFSSNYFYVKFFFMMNFKLLIFKLLICWRIHFIFLFQVYPELKAKRMLFKRSWDFRVNNASSSCHPLDISWSNFSFMPFKVFMEELSLKHISNSFKATVGMIGKASR